MLNRPTRTRSRSTTATLARASYRQTISGTPVINRVDKVDVALRQVTADQINPGWTFLQYAKDNESYLSAQAERFAKLDLGGHFTSTQNYVLGSPANVHSFVREGIREYNFGGNVLAQQPTSNIFPQFPLVDTAEMFRLGGTAIARCKPTNPNADLLTFLGELKGEGLPSFQAQFLKRKLGFFRSLGNDYLNLEFGWKPFVRDLQDTARAVKRSESLIKEFVGMSGKPINKRFSFPDEESSTTTTISTSAYGWPVGGTQNYSSPGRLTRTDIVRKKTWFEGQFVYYVNPGSTQMDNLRRQSQIANSLLGTRLTPEVVWNLTPWSWLVDWAFNFGDLFSNIGSFGNDGLVMRRGYIMQTREIEARYELSGLTFKGQSPIPSIVTTYGSRVKIRRGASPYGFGLTLPDMNPKRWAILTALGLAQGPGSMKYQ